MKNEITDLLTLPEAAVLLRLKVSTLRAWRLQKRLLPFVKVGRKICVRRNDVQNLIEASVQKPVKEAAA
jgi:excisionase family DNA binding protein